MRRRILAACAAAALALPNVAAAADPTERTAAVGASAYRRLDEELPSSPVRGPDMSSHEAEIRNVIERRYPGFVRSGDAEGYASQFTDDALWMPPGETDRKGPRAIARTLGAELETWRLRPLITIREMSILGDHAWVIGRDEITVQPRDGGAEAHVVYTVFWLLRRVEGEWKIARQIWNEKPAD